MKPLRLHAALQSAGNNFANPFVSYTIAAANAPNLLVGYVQGVGQLGGPISQVWAGRLVDRVGERVKTIFLANLLAGLFWIAVSFGDGPYLAAIVYTGVVLTMGIYGGAWNSLIGEMVGPNGRGRFLSRLAATAGFGGLLALVATTPLTALFGTFRPAFLIAGLLLIASGLVIRPTPEPEVLSVGVESAPTSVVSKYYAATAIFGLFWGFAWPLFTITQVKVLQMKPEEFALAAALGAGSTLAFQPIAGKMVDRNRRVSLFISRFSLITFPIAFAIATSPLHIYILNITTGLLHAILNVAPTAYLYDIAPEGQKGRFASEFNLVNGLSTMVGSFAGATALELLTPSVGLAGALTIGYIISAIGRGSSSLLYLTLPRESFYGERLSDNSQRYMEKR